MLGTLNWLGGCNDLQAILESARQISIKPYDNEIIYVYDGESEIARFFNGKMIACNKEILVT